MSIPAPRAEEDTLHGDVGWPQPSQRVAPRPVAQPPRRRPRRQRYGIVWAFALVGVALAAAAGLWYARLDSGPPSRLTVPSVVGLKEAAAIKTLRTLGLAVRSIEMPGPGKAGLVFRQRPAAGVTAPRGNVVTVDVASGK